MKAVPKLYRQGDVLLIPEGHPRFVAPTGQRSPKLSTVAGRHVLAYGEVTGHHHSLPVSCGVLELDEGGLTYLTIEQLTEVTHQEHDPITLPPGRYLATIQREWSDALEPRQVAD